jgi:hypothetical protein
MKKNNIVMKYAANKNKLIITPQDRYPVSPFVSVFIPANIKSKTGKTLESNKMLIFAYPTLNDEAYLYKNLDRKSKGITLERGEIK